MIIFPSVAPEKGNPQQPSQAADAQLTFSRSLAVNDLKHLGNNEILTNRQRLSGPIGDAQVRRKVST